MTVSALLLSCATLPRKRTLLAGIAGLLLSASAVFAADTKGGKVFVYTVTGRWVGQIDTPGPVDVACWGDWVFVTDQVHHCIRKFRRLKG